MTKETINVGICEGIVESVQGTSPGPASGITYTVVVTDQVRNATLRLANVVPAWNRWPDAIDTVAFAPNPLKKFPAIMVGHNLYCFIPETVDFGDCSGGNVSGGAAFPLFRTLGGVR